MFQYCFAVLFFITGWLPLGIIQEDGYSTPINSRTAYGPNGNPVAVYQLLEGGTLGQRFTVYVKRWNGSEWEQLGGFLDGSRQNDAKNPTIAVDSTGTIYAAFYETIAPRNGRFQVVVKSWDGTSWQLVGNPLLLDNAGNALGPALTIDPLDRPIVATGQFTSGQTGSDLYVHRWDGTHWQALGQPVASALSDVPNRGAMTNNVLGNPVIAYRDGHQIRAAKWNGRRWVNMGGPLNADPTQQAYAPQMSMGSTGRLFASWHEHDPVRGALVTRAAEWRNGAWHALGGIINDTALVNSGGASSLTVRGKQVPIISWVDFDTKDLYVSQYIRARDEWFTVRRRAVTTMFGHAHMVDVRNGKIELTVTTIDKDALLLRQP